MAISSNFKHQKIMLFHIYKPRIVAILFAGASAVTVHLNDEVLLLANASCHQTQHFKEDDSNDNNNNCDSKLISYCIYSLGASGTELFVCRAAGYQPALK